MLSAYSFRVTARSSTLYVHSIAGGVALEGLVRLHAAVKGPASAFPGVPSKAWRSLGFQVRQCGEVHVWV